MDTHAFSLNLAAPDERCGGVCIDYGSGGFTYDWVVVTGQFDGHPAAYAYTKCGTHKVSMVSGSNQANVIRCLYRDIDAAERDNVQA